MTIFVQLHATAEQIAAFKEAGHDVKQAAGTAADHVIAALKTLPGAAQVIDAIKAAKDPAMSGVQKLEHIALTDALPFIMAAETGGLVSLVNSAKDTAFALVPSLFNDIAAGIEAAAGKVAGATHA
jgi:hypothetical protein